VIPTCVYNIIHVVIVKYVNDSFDPLSTVVCIRLWISTEKLYNNVVVFSMELAHGENQPTLSYIMTY